MRQQFAVKKPVITFVERELEEVQIYPTYINDFVVVEISDVVQSSNVTIKIVDGVGRVLIEHGEKRGENGKMIYNISTVAWWNIFGMRGGKQFTRCRKDF